MLKQLLSKLVKRNAKQWTETEVRELIVDKQYDQAIAAIEKLHHTTHQPELVRLCIRAEIAFRSRSDTEAESLYREALAKAPGLPEAHFGLSTLMHARGEFEPAYNHALFAYSNATAEPRYQAQLGLCHLLMGNYPQAEDLLRKVLHRNSKDKIAWNNLGIALLSKGRAAEARSCFANSLKLDPSFEQAQTNLEQLNSDTGYRQTIPAAPDLDLEHFWDSTDEYDAQHIASLAGEHINEPWQGEWKKIHFAATSGQLNHALTAAENLILDYPNSDKLAVLTDYLYRQSGDPDSGVAVLQACLARNPESANLHFGLGQALTRYNDNAAAEPHLKKAIDLGLRSQTSLIALARVLSKSDRYAEAFVLYEECSNRWPSDINLAYSAIAHYQVCDYERALYIFSELEERNLVSHLGLQSVYAQVLAYIGHVERAALLMDEQIRQNGAGHNLRVARAGLHLLCQNFADGWDGYRYRQLGLRSFRVLPAPEWQGEGLVGKTIVVLAEQGLGDQVMFSSCLPDLLKLGPQRVVVEAIHRVAPTLMRSFPDCEFISTKQDQKLNWLKEVGHVDFYIPLGELPRHFRRSLTSFPQQAYLVPNPDRVLYWRNKMEALGPGPYFGTSWRGGTELTRSSVRTLDPALLIDLVRAIPSHWLCLQYGDVHSELATFSAAGATLTYWPEAIADLDEFAAMIAALDGVFTVCNTTVHYAGAVGQRTWVLAPKVPEWRYGLTNSRMPWYPAVEILRQPQANDWASVITEAKRRLTDNYCHLATQN